MRIKQLLAEKGVTAKALALSTGLTEMGLSKIITGKSSPNADTIQKIASALDVPCGALFDDYADDEGTKHNSTVCPYCGKPLSIEIK